MLNAAEAAGRMRRHDVGDLERGPTRRGTAEAACAATALSCRSVARSARPVRLTLAPQSRQWAVRQSSFSPERRMTDLAPATQAPPAKAQRILALDIFR